MVKSRAAELAMLARLTGAVLAARQAELHKILVREEELRRQLRDLSATAKDRAEVAAQTVDTALLAGADVRWLVWVEERRTILTAELARTLAEKENHRDALTKAFGRDQATTALWDRARTDQLRDMLRRADNVP